MCGARRGALCAWRALGSVRPPAERAQAGRCRRTPTPLRARAHAHTFARALEHPHAPMYDGPCSARHSTTSPTRYSVPSLLNSNAPAIAGYSTRGTVYCTLLRLRLRRTVKAKLPSLRCVFTIFITFQRLRSYIAFASLLGVWALLLLLLPPPLLLHPRAGYPCAAGGAHHRVCACSSSCG